MSKITVVTGNIASGKSTYLSKLPARENQIIRPQPVDKWTLFKPFYEVLKKKPSDLTLEDRQVVFEFQLQILMSYRDMMQEAIESQKDLIMECHPWFSIECFATNLNVDLYLSNEHLRVLGEMMGNDEILSYPIEQLVYIETDAKECHKRYIKRGRLGESVSRVYLKDLDKRFNIAVQAIEARTNGHNNGTLQVNNVKRI